MGGFVLVGGRSQRMGRDKALLELQGRPLFLRAVELLRPHVAEVILLGSPARYAQYDIPTLADRYPGRGPLAALCAALENARYEWNLFLACDLPFLEGRFLDLLVQRALAGSAEAVVPHLPDGWQPLCAAYNRACLPSMQRALEGTNGIVEGLAACRVHTIDASELAANGFPEQMFRNMNTLEDWEAVKSTWELRQP